MTAVLVVGGAGYIGSHMVKLLANKGCEVTTIDNLSGGHQGSVLAGEFVYGDISDQQLLENLFRQKKFDVVMHFASFIQVGESVGCPKKYYQNNLINTLNLLNAMYSFGISKFIFSSTAAIFGEPQYIPVDEMHPQRPINPYGRTKLMVEQALVDYEKAYGIKSICLRYFNAAGADPDGELGELHEPETHLIPLVLQVASGRRSHISVFGRDYDTLDGTCIRDYVHVSDLCNAHWLALCSLMKGDGSQSYNLGNGNGYSVQEVIDAAHTITGQKINVVDEIRRAGDPARLIADSRLIQERLNWRPQYTMLEIIIEHAWKWELKRKFSS